MKKEIAQVKDEIRKLGNVNVNAIEEYKEISERHAFLSGQYATILYCGAFSMCIARHSGSEFSSQ